MKLRAYLTAKLSQFIEWACFRAYNHAKRRESERRRWIPTTQAAIPDWNDDQRSIRGREAAQVLENRHFREAWESLNDDLDASILACDVYGDGGPDRATRLVLSKQTLFRLRREFVRKIEDGIMAESNLEERRKRELAGVRVFRR